VDDLVEGIIRMMNGPSDFLGPVNLGNPGEFTIRELAEMTIEMTGSSSKLTFSQLPADDPVRRRPDIALAKKRLSWEPRVALRDGLAKTIAWFRTIDVDAYRPPTPNY
jgi:UDP-glucuronate decarboxylase